MNVSRPSEFKRLDDKFFLKINDNELKLISNKKELVKLYPKHEEAISSFIKDNKLKLKDETDLKILVTFLNQLN